NASLAALVFVGIALGLWWWAAGTSSSRPSPPQEERERTAKGTVFHNMRYLAGGGFGILAALVAMGGVATLLYLAREHSLPLPRELSFVAPVQQPESSLQLWVSNVPEKISFFRVIGYAWPVLLAVMVWIYGRLGDRGRMFKDVARLVGWMLPAWA